MYTNKHCINYSRHYYYTMQCILYLSQNTDSRFGFKNSLGLKLIETFFDILEIILSKNIVFNSLNS